MIYQLFFRREQLARCFPESEVYAHLPNSPALNPDILTVLPELANPAIEAQAREAAGIFYLARRVKRDRHPWVGTTSWRQLDKTPCHFTDTSSVEDLLTKAPIVAWHMLGWSSGCWVQGEQHHPGLLQYIREIHQRFPKVVTAEGLACYESRQTRLFPFSSYWLMSWELLHEFVETLTPEWDYMVANYATDPYLKSLTYAPDCSKLNSHQGGLSGAWAAFFERYFGIWVHQTGRTLMGLDLHGQPDLRGNRPSDPRWKLENIGPQKLSGREQEAIAQYNYGR